jgi:hypothetical protein
MADTLKPKAPPGDITGRVVNENGEPLGGANIVIKRTGKGTQANANGEFVLKGVDGDVVMISFVGYETKEIRMNGKNFISNITLSRAASSLNEVILNGGYYTTTQRLNTGNISKVTSEEISRQPVMNLLQAIQERVAGLDIQQTSGYASAPIKVELRGRNSIDPNFTSYPLYIIEGVPLTVLRRFNRY